MRVAIVGSRNFNDFSMFEKEIDKYKDKITEIVSGGAKGADKLAQKYTKKHNIPIKIFKPDWKRFGKRAGIVRNREIVENSDLVIAFWDGKSKGTKFTIEYAKSLNKEVVIVKV